MWINLEILTKSVRIKYWLFRSMSSKVTVNFCIYHCLWRLCLLVWLLIWGWHYLICCKHRKSTHIFKLFFCNTNLIWNYTPEAIFLKIAAIYCFTDFDCNETVVLLFIYIMWLFNLCILILSHFYFILKMQIIK